MWLDSAPVEDLLSRAQFAFNFHCDFLILLFPANFGLQNIKFKQRINVTSEELNLPLQNSYAPSSAPPAHIMLLEVCPNFSVVSVTLLCSPSNSLRGGGGLQGDKTSGVGHQGNSGVQREAPAAAEGH